MTEFAHFDEHGSSRMVDVSGKAEDVADRRRQRQGNHEAGNVETN